jgi:hypothetical protein
MNQLELVIETTSKDKFLDIYQDVSDYLASESIEYELREDEVAFGEHQELIFTAFVFLVQHIANDVISETAWKAIKSTATQIYSRIPILQRKEVDLIIEYQEKGFKKRTYVDIENAERTQEGLIIKLPMGLKITHE